MKDPISRWLDNNTAMFGPVPTMKEREIQEKEEFNEKINRIFRTKRFIYQLWHYFEDPNWCGWISIGQYEVDDKEDLENLVKKMEKKYSSEVKSEMIRRNW